jgi:hypothetical protein
MRNLVLFLLTPLCVITNAQTKKIIESKIEKVTVFLDGAQVERNAKTILIPGKYELVFAGISPSIDKQSIQVKADGAITVLSVIHQLNFLKEQQKQEEIREIETQREALSEKIALQRNILNVYKQEETMLVKNQEIGGLNTGLKAADLKEAADFQRARLTEVYQKQMETDRIIKKLESELSKMNQQLVTLNQKSGVSTSEIHVTVNVKENTNSNFALSYLVGKSGWYSTYDIRVKDISSPINLEHKANVFQSSGEDWKDIKMWLSTGNPHDNGTKPSVSPWYLKYGYAVRMPLNTIGSSYTAGTYTGRVIDENGNPVPGVSILIKGSRTGVAADNSGAFRMQAKPGDIMVISGAGFENQEVALGYNNNVQIMLRPDDKLMSEVVVTAMGVGRDEKDLGYYADKNIRKKKDETAINTTTTYQPTTVIYEIDDPYTVLNDGKTYTVDINAYEIDAAYEYYAVPKIEADAFLTAKIVDWQELNLLPGEANLFFEGTYLGKSLLDVTTAGDTLNISLGKDKGVVVKRTLVKEFSSKKFIGSNKTDTRQYEITVRNNKQQAVNIIIEDQFPISTQKEIEVQEKKFEGAKLDDDTQKITWLLAVEAKKENKLHFRYEVKYPKEKLLQLD